MIQTWLTAVQAAARKLSGCTSPRRPVRRERRGCGHLGGIIAVAEALERRELLSGAMNTLGIAADTRLDGHTTQREPVTTANRSSGDAIVLDSRVFASAATPNSNANVAVSVVGTTLTLTSDNKGNHNVDLYRLDSNHIEVDGGAATTINGSASQVFVLTSVYGITVNVGNGYDTYHLYSKAGGNPALNIGLGGILFQGTGGLGDDLEVYNKSDAAMTIQGSVIVQGTNAGALAESGASDSYAALYANGNAGSTLNVNGFVSFKQKGTGTGGQYNSVHADNAGSVNVSTFVSETSLNTNSGTQHNSVYNEGGGSVTVGDGGIAINESNISSTAYKSNTVYTSSTGSLSTTGQIVIVATNNSSGPSIGVSNGIDTESAQSSGSLSALGLKIIDSGSDLQTNFVGSGGAAISIGAMGITIVGSGSGVHHNNIFSFFDNSPITVAGSVNVTDAGSGHSEFYLSDNSPNSGITIAGNVMYNNSHNMTAYSYVFIGGDQAQSNSAVTIKGALAVYLAQTVGTASDSAGFSGNSIQIGLESATGYGTIINGFTSIVGGNGKDWVAIFSAQLNQGASINLQSNSATGSDYLEIYGSVFGGGLTAVLTGDNAKIDINNFSDQATTITGLFYAIMPGSHPVISVAAIAGFGDIPVAFNGTARIVGTAGQGGLFRYRTGIVMGTIIVTYFTKIAV